MTTKKNGTVPLTDKEREYKWKVIQGLAALVLLENKGKDIKITCRKK